jgi:hypothetical protein
MNRHRSTPHMLPCLGDRCTRVTPRLGTVALALRVALPWQSLHCAQRLWPPAMNQSNNVELPTSICHAALVAYIDHEGWGCSFAHVVHHLVLSRALRHSAPARTKEVLVRRPSHGRCRLSRTRASMWDVVEEWRYREASCRHRLGALQDYR